MGAHRTGTARRGWMAAVLSAALLALAACGSGGGDEESGGGTAAGGGGGSCELPGEVKVAAIQELTGPAAFAGLSAQKGVQLAVKEINEQGEILGDSTLVVEYSDTAGNAQTAASQATEAISNDEYVAAFGPVTSGTAVAVAPVAERGQLPIVFSQAGSDGVVIGDYTFRITPPMATYYTKIADYITAEGVETMSVVYTSDFPTLNGIATTTLPDIAEETGVEIQASVGVPLATQDFTAPISQGLESDPDMMAILLVGAQNPTAMRQLRQAGFTGPVIGNSGAGAGNLAPAGQDGAGMTWPATFNYEEEGETTQVFVEAYNAEYGENPLNYAAEAYDGTYWLARAIAEGCDRAGTQAGLQSIAGEGFTGALGEITFEGNDARLPGLVVQWDGTKEIILTDL
jgi:branched-chain amino acid transport system substrate-binding protein